MSVRVLLRILLLVALIPLVLRTRDRGRPARDLDDIDEGMDDAPLGASNGRWDADEETEELAGLDDDLLLDINSAPRAALLALPGIDEEHADLIIEQRPFRSKHDLLRLGIVADDIYRAIRDHIVARKSSVSPGPA